MDSTAKKTKSSKSLSMSFLMLILLNLVLFMLLSFLSPTFFTVRNITAIMQRMSELSLLAIAQTLVIIIAGLDLSVGAVMALSGSIVGILYGLGVPIVFAVLTAFCAGLAVGLLNGFLVVKLRLQPFIVTLATMTIVRSIVHAMLQGRVITSFPDGYLDMGYVNVFGIPAIFLIMFICAFMIHVLLKKTTFGKSVFATGANEQCAFMAGIHIRRVKYLVYALSSVLCALAGILFTMRNGAMIPDAGLNAPLEVITAALIGGASIAGGKGSVVGSFLGILAMYLLRNGLSLLGLNPFWGVIVLGAILIYVVGQDSFSKKIKPFQIFKRKAQTQ